MKKTTEVYQKTKQNLIGAGIGAIAGYIVSKTVVKTEKNWLIAVCTVAGAIAGAFVSAKIKAKNSVPTQKIVITQ